MTVLNEANTIPSFLDSLDAQTVQPDKVVIVDGGSTDGTLALLKGRAQGNSRLSIVSAPKANIAGGRNLGIQLANSEIVAITDAGCTLKEDWFEEITRPLIQSAEIEAVAGFFVPVSSNATQMAIAGLTYPNRGELIAGAVLPSSRSVAFRVDTWRRVGGYPEWLNYGEDTFLDRKLKKFGVKMVANPNAIVYWPPRKNLGSFFKQYLNYSVWDTVAGYHRPRLQSIGLLSTSLLLILLALVSDVAGYLLIFLALGYTAYFMSRVAIRSPQHSAKAILMAVPVRITLDVAQVAGAMLGLWKRAKEFYVTAFAD